MLLIDLRSPKEQKTSTWNDLTIVDTENQKWEVFEDDQNKKMDFSFTEFGFIKFEGLTNSHHSTHIGSSARRNIITNPNQKT